MISFYDIHAHYTDAVYKKLDIDPREIIKDCFSYDTYRIICSGTNPENSKEAVELSKQFRGMAASVGIHPTDAFFIEDIDFAVSEIEKLVVSEEDTVAAIGEIGLDYSDHELTDKNKQKYIFDALLTMSETYDLPCVIHCRDAIGDTVDMIRRHPRARGAFHCFSGSPETALELVKLGWYISIAGNVTFKKSDKLLNVVKAVGAEHLLTETDAPYMTPAPSRGMLNNSSFIRESAEVMANELGMMLKDFSKITRDNADRLFRPMKFLILNKKRV